jgi:hypothetical protein
LTLLYLQSEKLLMKQKRISFTYPSRVLQFLTKSLVSLAQEEFFLNPLHLVPVSSLVAQ